MATRCGYNHALVIPCPVCDRRWPRPASYITAPAVLLLAMLGTASATETPADRAWQCQIERIRPDGTMPASAACVCRAAVGLPETMECRRLRGAKRRR